MCRFRVGVHWGSRLAITAGLVALAVGPEAVRGRVAGALVAARRAAGAARARHDLDRMAGGLVEARVAWQRARAHRERLARWLPELEARSREARTRAERGRGLLARIEDLRDRVPDVEDRADLEREAGWQWRKGREAGLEVAELDIATRALALELADADRRIEAARDRLAHRESDLARLRAAVEARQLRRELADLDDLPARWQARADDGH